LINFIPALRLYNGDKSKIVEKEPGMKFNTFFVTLCFVLLIAIKARTESIVTAPVYNGNSNQVACMACNPGPSDTYAMAKPGE
jgi:hypothetical protein